MLNIFKSKKRIIAEIHNEFDTSSERLLNESKTVIFSENEDAVILEYLGFEKAQKVRKRREEKAALEMSKKTAEKINYYRQHYPFNKFITEKDVEKICKKYGLVMGNVGDYIGDVPKKNIQEMNNFSLRDEDGRKVFHHWIEHTGRGYMLGKQTESGRYGYFSNFGFVEDKEQKGFHFENPPFKICASPKEFNMEKRKIVGFKIEIDDPIVLQPVDGGYLIVTKWGLEASDEAVVNSIEN